MASTMRIGLIALLAAAPVTARAELRTGAAAPTFTAAAAEGGKDLTIDLSEWLSKGPVVIYFYPKSFTSVCTEEAHLFAEAMAEFKSLRASVVGISSDAIETQREFSRLECRDKFPVAADPKGQIVRAYDVVAMQSRADAVMARRTSYVIAPDGKIASVLTSPDAASHIRNALQAVRDLQAK